MKHIKKEDVWIYKLVKPTSVDGTFTSLLNHPPNVNVSYRIGHKSLKQNMPLMAYEFTAEGYEKTSSSLYLSREINEEKNWPRVLKCKAELWPHPVYRLISPVFIGFVSYTELKNFWRKNQFSTVVTEYDVIDGEYKYWAFCKWVLPFYDVTDEF